MPLALLRVAHQPSPTSRTAKCKAPLGSDSKNCAPAPLESVAHVRGSIAPKDPFVCNNVLTTLAGWRAVCATLSQRGTMIAERSTGPSERNQTSGMSLSEESS